jgi:hypothetical protein
MTIPKAIPLARSDFSKDGVAYRHGVTAVVAPYSEHAIPIWIFSDEIRRKGN